MNEKDMKKEMEEQLEGYLKEAIAYLRYSSHMQDDGVSIEYQIMEIEEYARKNGYVITEWYIDKAETAKEVAGRDEFLRMFREIEQGKTPKALIIWGTNRAFRNATESDIYRAKLRKNEVKLMSATQNLDEDTHSGRLLIDLIARIDQYKVEEIGAHVSSAMKLLLKEKLHTGGIAPYGFKTVPVIHNGKPRKKLEVFEEEAEVIRSAFHMFVSGVNISQIATRLKDLGVVGRNGTPMPRDTIKWILKNELYKGVKSLKMKFGDSVRVEDYCEPIVSPEIFEAAQKQLAHNRESVRGRKKKRLYPLTGKITCSCGLAMTGHANRGNHTYYVCQARKRLRECTTKPVRQDWLEQAVFKAICDNILSDKAVNQITSDVLQKIKKAPAKAESKKELLARKQILVAEISKLVQKNLDGSLSDEILNTMKQGKDDELASINRKLKEIELANESIVNKDYIKKCIKSIFDSELGYDQISEELRADIFNQVVESIEINESQVVIHLRVPLSPNRYKEGFQSPYHRLNPQVIARI